MNEIKLKKNIYYAHKTRDTLVFTANVYTELKIYIIGTETKKI